MEASVRVISKMAKDDGDHGHDGCGDVSEDDLRDLRIGMRGKKSEGRHGAQSRDGLFERGE